MSMVASVASAHDFEVDGIYYKITFSTDYTVYTAVSYRGNSKGLYDSYSEYSGDVAIPESVTYKSRTYSVTSIGDWAFSGCPGLTSITIPNGVTSIGDRAFSKCTGLTSIEIPNSVTSIGGCAFSECTGLTSITIPNSVTSIGGGAFYGCTGLSSIKIPNSVTSIGSAVFSKCTALTSIVVEKGNSIYDSRDNCNAIIETATNTLVAGCQNTIIPNSVTSIGNFAFEYCTGLTSITIPNSVTSIGDWAFADCGGLTDVYCFATDVPATGNHVFSYASTSSATLHVPAASIEAYKKTNPWNEFGTIVPLTDEELTGIDRLTMDNGQSTTSEGVYDLNGRRRVQIQKGVNIVRQSNGSVKRIMVK